MGELFVYNVNLFWTIIIRSCLQNRHELMSLIFFITNGNQHRGDGHCQHPSPVKTFEASLGIFEATISACDPLLLLPSVDNFSDHASIYRFFVSNIKQIVPHRKNHALNHDGSKDLALLPVPEIFFIRHSFVKSVSRQYFLFSLCRKAN